MKSQEEFYLRLHAQLIQCDPLETSVTVNKSLERDLETLVSRTRKEGVAFLTKSLPRLGKAFDRGLVTGRFKPPVGFRKAHKGTCIPAFLQEYINLVFDNTGLLLDEVPVGAIKHIRQVLFFAYKLEIPYSELENSRVIENFIKTDQELELNDDPLANEILSLAKIITGKVFRGFNPKDILPRHGPGAVATGEKGFRKWVFARHYNQIHQVFPYYDYYVVGGARELSDRLDWYRNLQRLESGTAKVVLVPKDSRGPRLISCEPLEYQWIQQGLGRKLAAFLESDSRHTQGAINFTDQGINSNLAKTGSASRRWATIDLRDASDRVSLGLVRRVFQDSAKLLRALEACRTTATKLPNGKVIPLKKFAPMGSALCFPVEAYIFWVVIVAAVVHGKNLPLQRVEKLVYVYGDDIVVPTKWAELSIQALESVGLLVNVDKSCFTGFFRESCGVEAYKGTDVTPFRLRKPWLNRVSSGTVLYSYAHLANEMAVNGYKSAAQFLWNEIEATYGKMPYVTYRTSAPGKLVNTPEVAEFLNRSQFPVRFNRAFQRLEFLLPSLSLRRRRFEFDGWPRLLRDMVTPPFGDPLSMVLPLSMRIKRGWTSIT